MTADQLVAVRMKKQDMARDDVQAFHCGELPHETPLAEWLKKHSAERIDAGEKIWRYHEKNRDGSEGALVGYGSIGKSGVRTTDLGPDGERVRLKVVQISMLALHKAFWGYPKVRTDDEARYSRQIVRHLQERARAEQKGGKNVERILLLYVHPSAPQAQQLYRDCSFALAPGNFGDHGQLYDMDTDTFLLGMCYCWDAED